VPIVESVAPAPRLSVLDGTELVVTGVLKGTPVRLCLGGCVLPAGHTGLVDRFMDLASPPRLATPLASLTPRGRDVAYTRELR
jgi:hypothetical protein